MTLFAGDELFGRIDFLVQDSGIVEVLLCVAIASDDESSVMSLIRFF